VPVNYSR